MNASESDVGVIAEIALGAGDLREFEAAWLEYLRPRIGFETACSVWSETNGAVREVTSVGYDEPELRRRFPSYMSELSPLELARFSGQAPVVDLDVVSASRRERLTVYRELLAPHGVQSFVTNVCKVPWGVFGFHLGRARGTPFGARDTQRLTLLAPCIKVGQGLLAERLRPSSRPDPEAWAMDWSLTPREREVARLVQRGFSNPEVATLLRVSPHTVRNHLVSVFRKAEVSSRAELVFTMVSAPEARHENRRRGRSAWAAFLAHR